MDAMRRFEKGDRRFPQLGPQEEERVLGTAVYDAVYHSTTERLAASELRRRALLLFSDGEDNSSAYHLLDAIESIQSAGALFYGIRYTDAKRGRFNARNKYGVRVFDRIAADTGGAHFDAQHQDLRRHFRQIGEELRSSYELAYHSSNPNRDNTFRKILIRAKTPGLTIRAKAGYYAR
jgi:Ca-activated chloride channel family protein